jgi:hypothetical protein
MNPKRTDENHSFNIHVAAAIGVEKAILMKELYGWCSKNMDNNRNMWGGFPWTYNSARAFGQKFMYFKPRSIARWLIELEAENWIASHDGFNRAGFDKTKHYTVNFGKYDCTVFGKTQPEEEQISWIKAVNSAISQNGEWISQNGQTIPSLNNSLPSRTQERENAQTSQPEFDPFDYEQETPTPPVAAAPPCPADYFAPDKHSRAAEAILAFLDEHSHYLGDLAALTPAHLRRAVEGHCLKLQKLGKWHEVTVPENEHQFYSWIGSRIAGVTSWAKAAKEFDNQKKSNTNGKAENGLLISDEGIAEVFARVRASGLGGY